MAPVWIILLATIMVFWPVVGFEFTGYDDNGNVGTNPDFNPVTARSLGRYWTGPHMDMYIPVTYTVWAGLATMARTEGKNGAWVLEPGVFHAANLLLHAAGAVMVYLIVRKILQRSGWEPGRLTDWAACAGAVLFAVHPIQVEAVAWVSGLRDVLGGLLALGAVWFYLEYVSSVGRKRRWMYVGGIAAFGLSLLSKPSAISLPIAVAVVDWIVFQRKWLEVIKAVGGWIVVAGVVAVVTKVVQPASTLTGVAIWARGVVALDAISMYLNKIVWPEKLGIDYGRSPEWLLSSGEVWWAWLPAAVGLSVLWVKRKEWRLAACAGCVFVAILLPVLGVVKFEFQRHSTVADRYAYLAMLGTAIGLAALVRRWPSRKVGALVGCLLVLYGSRACWQVWTWKNSQAVFSHALKVNPTSLAGNNWMGLSEGSQGHFDKAIEYFRTAIEAHPEDSITNYNMGDLLLHIGDPADAVEPLQKALIGGRREWFEYLKLAMAQSQNGDAASAIMTCEAGVKRWPLQEELWEILGALQTHQENWPAAREAFERAVALNPGSTIAQAGLSAVQQHMNMPGRN